MLSTCAYTQDMKFTATKEQNMATTTTTDERWIWKTSKGHLVDIYPIATPLDEWNGGEGWYADFPDQAPPQNFRLDNLTTGESITRTVLPLRGLGPFVAIQADCWRWGWEDTTYVDPGKCEHGLSAADCVGPMHWYDDPMDDYLY